MAQFRFDRRGSNGVEEMHAHEVTLVTLDQPHTQLLIGMLGEPNYREGRDGRHHWWFDVVGELNAIEVRRPCVLSVDRFGNGVVAWLPWGMGRMLVRALRESEPTDLIVIMA